MSLANLYSATGTIPWSTLDFTGSSITDIFDREHNHLQSLQGGTSGEYYHLTAAEYSSLTATDKFTTIQVSGESDIVADDPDDILTLVAGTGITISTNAGTDTITFDVDPVFTFGTIAVAGESDVVADAENDTLTLVAGTNMTITTNAAGDEITFEASGSGPGGGMDIGLALALQNRSFQL